MLRPRRIEVDGEGRVAFLDDASAPRIVATDALRHRYIKQYAVDTKPLPAASSEEAEEGALSRERLDCLCQF